MHDAYLAHKPPDDEKNVRVPWQPYSRRRKNASLTLIDRDNVLLAQSMPADFLPIAPRHALAYLPLKEQHANQEPVQVRGVHLFH